MAQHKMSAMCMRSEIPSIFSQQAQSCGYTSTIEPGGLQWTDVILKTGYLQCPSPLHDEFEWPAYYHLPSRHTMSNAWGCSSQARSEHSHERSTLVCSLKRAMQSAMIGGPCSGIGCISETMSENCKARLLGPFRLLIAHQMLPLLPRYEIEGRRSRSRWRRRGRGNCRSVHGRAASGCWLPLLCSPAKLILTCVA